MRNLQLTAEQGKSIFGLFSFSFAPNHSQKESYGRDTTTDALVSAPFKRLKQN